MHLRTSAGKQASGSNLMTARQRPFQTQITALYKPRQTKTA